MSHEKINKNLLEEKYLLDIEKRLDFLMIILWMFLSINLAITIKYSDKIGFELFYTMVISIIVSIILTNYLKWFIKGYYPIHPIENKKLKILEWSSYLTASFGVLASVLSFIPIWSEWVAQEFLVGFFFMFVLIVFLLVINQWLAPKDSKWSTAFFYLILFIAFINGIFPVFIISIEILRDNIPLNYYYIIVIIIDLGLVVFLINRIIVYFILRAFINIKILYNIDEKKELENMFAYLREFNNVAKNFNAKIEVKSTDSVLVEGKSYTNLIKIKKVIEVKSCKDLKKNIKKIIIKRYDNKAKKSKRVTEDIFYEILDKCQKNPDRLLKPRDIYEEICRSL